MLRLTPPNYEKIRMANSFEVTYGGSEANIAMALANLGLIPLFLRWFPIIPSGKVQFVCCAPMMSTARR